LHVQKPHSPVFPGRLLGREEHRAPHGQPSQPD
jgi:hypothetical protein